MSLTPLDPAIPPIPMSRIAIYGPRELADDFHMDKRRDEIEPVLAKIDKIYKLAKQEAVDGRLDCDYGYGFCLGLLDPATNIRVNNIICNVAAAALPGKVGDVPRRSLDGLVAFLTCLFPYLPDAEALAYLDAAELDPLVAALLIINRRGMRQFGFCSGTTVAAVETALRCAALVAEHPNPQLLVAGWKSISGLGLGKVVLCSFPDADDVNCLQTARCDLQLKESWAFARCRLERLVPIGKELPPVRAAMKRMLLATIHGFYLKALSSLPSDELTGKYHRGMLLGGYCYGPLDPVENIIVNTIWYEQTFPSSKGFRTSMISTSCLWQMAARSMYGLVSFLCTRYPCLTPDLALQRLLVAGANLRIADPNLFDKPSDEELDWSKSPQIGSGMDTAFMQRNAVHKMAATATVPEAYAAAAAVAFHPSPDALIHFLASPGSANELEAISEALLQCVRDGNQILAGQFHQLCTRVSFMSHQQRESEPTEIDRDFYLLVSQRIGRFWGQHDRINRKVVAALEEFNKTKASKYTLHVICGVNELVSGPHFSSDPEVKGYNPWTPHKYHLAHVNFLATTFDDCGNPIASFFFAQCDNHGPETWCVPVAWPCPFTEQVRCIYCEKAGDRIVHPVNGGLAEFELYKSKGRVYTNDKVIRGRKDRVVGVEDGEIYYSYRVHDVEDVSEFARWKNLTQLPCW